MEAGYVSDQCWYLASSVKETVGIESGGTPVFIRVRARLLSDLV
jgi:hypothetical protein